MNAIDVSCPRCGQSLPADAPAGLCPRCLAAGGLSESEFLQDTAAASDSRGTLHIVIPEDLALPPGAPRRLGKYELLEEIARGGMGIVYKARHSGLDSIVAVKMIRAGVLARPADVERFRREARAAARLRHPNIVTIHDIGEQDGHHYYSMDYVPGANLAELARLKPFTARQAAEITAGVAAAIQHAHGQGVLHRDIKPSNVILTPEQMPRVLDFGLARIVADDSQLTVSGTPMGSPCYMPPEQAKGHAQAIDARSDVYSLGALLYELLTGRPPFHGATSVETLKLVLETEAISPRRFNTALPPDLETICLKCLEKEPKRRYASADELGQELDRFLHDRPIHARPIGHVERAWRWCRRNPFIASLSAAIFILLSTVAVGSSVAAIRIDHERQRSERLLYVANMNQVQQKMEQHNVMGVRELLEETAKFSERGFEWDYWYSQAHPELMTLPQSGPVLVVAFSPDGTRLLSTTAASPTAQVWDTKSGALVLTLKGDHRITSAAFSPDGRRIVTGSLDRTARVWDAFTGKELVSLRGHKDKVKAVVFSPNSQWIMTGSADKTARVWDAANGKEVLPPITGHTGGITSVGFSPDGQRILTASSDKSAKVWEAANGRELLVLRDHRAAISAAAFSPDGKWIVTASGDSKGPAFLPAERQLVGSSSSKPSPNEGFSTMRPVDQLTNAFGSTALEGTPAPKHSSWEWVENAKRLNDFDAQTEDPTARVWDAATGMLKLTLRGHTYRILSVAFSPDGRRIATSSLDHSAKVWDASTGINVATLEGHAEGVLSVAFSPDGERIVTGSADATMKLWPVTGINKSIILQEPGKEILSLAFSPDGTSLVTGCADGSARAWDVASGQSRFSLKGHAAAITSVGWSADGRRVATGSSDHTAEVWEAANGQELFPLKGHPDEIECLALSADGRWILTGGADGAKLWDASTGKERLPIKGHSNPVLSVAFSPDSQTVVTASNDGTAKLWTIVGARLLRSFQGHQASLLTVAFSPDGRRIVTGSEDGTANVWEIASGKELFSLRGHAAEVRSVTFSPDGRRILTGSGDYTAKLWDATIGKELLTLKGHNAAINAVAFSAHGHRIATGSADGTARVWEIPAQQRIARTRTEAVDNSAGERRRM
jgi:WD40 repeat protein/serine/threonine protein kinase